MTPGIYAAALLPYHPDLSCDTQQLADHCKDLLHHGADGIVLFGTTGEGPSLTFAERLRIIEDCIAYAVPPHKILVGVLVTALDEAVALTNKALVHNCAGVLVAPPYYYQDITEEGVLAFYRAWIQRVNNPSLKALLYHIPKYTKIPLTLSLMKALHDEFPESIVGLKDSEGNMSLVTEVLKNLPGFKVFMGREENLPEALQHGAAGAISGLTNIDPKLLRDPQKVRKLLDCFRGYPTIPALKSILHERKGPAWARLRPPLMPLREIERADLVKKMVAAGMIA